MTDRFSQYIPDENAMCAFGAKLIEAIYAVPNEQGVALYLNGDLGAGKTTLSRGMIQALGYQSKVKSPTYTLVEEYKFSGKTVYHFDLYRLTDPEELEFMGIRDYFAPNTLCLIEWAEKGAGMLMKADLLVNIAYADNARHIELVAQSPTGRHIIEQLNKLDVPQ
ncbi:tRNA (adenosine(37)-N6)-threonylcarbamoyltransferase complex ATPase subunit type 1 TsaE [Aggregatibacter kilianii]|uniref:tRNA (adenosine(37)-N6)-threonylcarbamoyltransferase complex ATPase subunit type 1 TsaE n=1 Tax=Aggregatibacter kilianii TaxID=2025884 RepID=UPI000D641129|nr:tRNA (adenosine(37)-N6)-threonylcarbamoyltransferase complex ATPase subunit type 1 TsaE [Aggregatibacter kilianii]